ncbi:MAG: DUF1116 domain-containing protein [Bacillota bacterium]
MPACKCILQARSWRLNTVLLLLPYVVMERNLGIRVSGLGDRWFTGPGRASKRLIFPWL